jgi:uroporphyrinogen-III synthase
VSRRKVIVTRAMPDAEDTGRRLTTLGFEAIFTPALTIRMVVTSAPDLALYQGICFTSAAGVRALVHLRTERGPIALCVGPATADAARAGGFDRIETGDGGVEGLANLVRIRLSPSDGPLLHACGTDIAGDLAAMLEASGFAVDRAVLYAAEPALSLSAPAIEALTAQTTDTVLFHSLRGAEAFLACVAAAGLESSLAGLDAIAISDRAARPLRGFRSVRVAGRPEDAAMLALLQQTQAP